ncbi:MAG: hypothetical protein MUE82_02095 [Chloroflexi bacterium]|jgi:hypothetical protein|nr:hypothetical protein [Chloroflexota bacterium]
MELVHAAAVVAGVALVALTLRSAVLTFVVPRGQREVITGAVLEIVAACFRPFIHHRPPVVGRLVSRSAALALFAPACLLCFYAAWLVLTWLGFALMYYGFGTEDATAALRLSGSSLFTLGFSEPPSGGTTAAVLAEAGIGLFLVALLIGYFPTIYGAYQRREVVVTTLEERAGVPASGVSLLRHHEQMGGWSAVDGLWEEYEAWFADVGESHIAIEILPFYRSLADDRSWVNAACVILDAAALRVAAIDAPPPPAARLVIRAGARSLWGIARHLGLDAGPKPAASHAGDDPALGTDARPVTVSRAQFDEARADLAAAGIPVVADPEEAWARFRELRGLYDRPVTVLAAVTSSPASPWIARIRPPRVRYLRLGRG